MSRSGRVLFALLAVFFTAWSLCALNGNDMISSSWARLGISPALGMLIGCLELLGAIALVVSLRWPALGFPTALGLAAMMVGASAFHIRTGHIGGAHGSVAILIACLFAAAAAYPATARLWRDMRATGTAIPAAASKLPLTRPPACTSCAGTGLAIPAQVSTGAALQHAA